MAHTDAAPAPPDSAKGATITARLCWRADTT
jgi:hypothetical protein